jgi:thiopurine S-methyltransferase
MHHGPSAPRVVHHAVGRLNAGRDNHLWLQCWRDQREDFHQITTNALLKRFWPGLNLPAGSRVFVPLCGKSLDMLWLAQQGHQVIGVELSPLAVQAFFAENSLPVSKRRHGKFTLWQSGLISILCGDYFALKANDLGAIDSIYDRAALTALPADIRQLYIAHQGKIVPPASAIFLLTIEDAEAGDTAEQALGVDQIAALYGDTHGIELAHIESVIEADPDHDGCSKPADYKVYRITGKWSGN